MVHSETTSGIVNDIDSVGELVKSFGKSFIVDAMSSFGGIPVNMKNIDFLVSCSNKCIQGVPGFAFVIARKSELAATRGNARTLRCVTTAPLASPPLTLFPLSLSFSRQLNTPTPSIHLIQFEHS